jgi:plasmid stabilization system protein ParE
VEVRFSELAARDATDADVWWRANRDAPDLFGDELRAAVLLLEGAPRVGPRVSGRDPESEVRRLDLRRTRYQLFYLVAERAVIVLRVWHSNRGERPEL